MGRTKEHGIEDSLNPQGAAISCQRAATNQSVLIPGITVRQEVGLASVADR